MPAPKMDHIIADFTGVGDSAEFPGRRLPSLSNGSFSRELPTSCIACALNVTHKVWNRIRIGLGQFRRLWQQELINYANNIREAVRKQQWFAFIMDRIANGIYNPTALSVKNVPVATSFGGWLCTGASGNTLTLQYRAGDDDPRLLEYVSYEENPDWYDGPSGTEPPTRWLSTQQNFALTPGATMLVSEPSQLYDAYGPASDGGGPAIRSVNIPAGLAVGGTFTATVYGDVGGLLLQKKPGRESEEITVAFLVHTNAREPWTIPRDCYPHWCRRAEKELVINAMDVFTIEAGNAIAVPDSSTFDYFTAYRQSGGEWVDCTADVWSLVRVEHASGGTYRSVIDFLAREDYATYNPLKLVYWVESAGNDTINAGQDRCVHSVCDYTGSYGDTDPVTGAKFYCDMRSLLKADLQGQGFIDNYRPKCLQVNQPSGSGCPYWAKDTVDNPLAAVREELTHSVPWCLTQLLVGLDASYFERKGPPSLGSASGLNLSVPSGNHENKNWGLATGGWPRALIYTDAVTGQQLVIGANGLEWLNYSSTGEQPPGGINFLNAASWPTDAPGANNFGKRLDYGADYAGAVNDPHKIARSQMTLAGVDRHMHTGAVTGRHGQFQRLRERWLFCPRLSAAAGDQTFGDVTFRWGYWDEDFNEQGSEDEGGIPTVYYARAVIAPGGAYGGLHTTGTILDQAGAVSLLGNDLTLYLEHKTLTASSASSSPGEEFTSLWVQGGTNVALPEPFRVRNYNCDQSTIGPGRGQYIFPGCAIVFDDPTLSSHPIKNRKFWVSLAKACAGGLSDSRIPNTNQSGANYTGAGAYFFAYNDPSEEVSAVSVTRNGGAVTLTAYSGSAGRPYQMPIDTYYYAEGTRTVGVTTYTGLWFWFSPKNGTGADAERLLSISVTTNTTTYDPVALNLETDATWGWNNVQDFTFTYSQPTGETILGVASVTITTRRIVNGLNEVVSLTAYGAPPASWAEWDRTKYLVLSSYPSQITIQVSPEWAGDMVALRVNMSGFTGTEGDYWNWFLAPHDLPNNSINWSYFADMIKVLEEDGWIADYLVSASLRGKTFSIYTNPVASPIGAEVWKSDTVIDTQLASGTNYRAFWANGEIFFKSGAIAAGNCLLLHAWMADRGCEPGAEEINSITRTIERIMYE